MVISSTRAKYINDRELYSTRAERTLLHSKCGRSVAHGKDIEMTAATADSALKSTYITEVTGKSYSVENGQKILFEVSSSSLVQS